MKILVVIPLAFGGGAEQVAAVLSREWAQTHSVRVLTYHLGPEQLDFGVPLETLAVPARPDFWGRITNAWRRVRAVRRLTREFQPDSVMAFMDEAGMVCVLAGLLDGWLSRLIVSVHHNPQWLSPLRRLMLALFYRFPARVVAVSQGVQEELRKSLHMAPARLAHIPNPLVLRPPEESGALPADLPSRFILFVGRLDWHAKGLDVLLDAYAALPAGRPPLLLVGDGADRGKVEEQAARLGLTQEVRLLGWVRDPRPFYQRASVFVMSSRFEGWSNVLMEAMGEGCLVAGTACPYGPPEILGPDLQHMLVPVGDSAALAQAIQARLTMPEQARRDLQAALRARAHSFAAPDVAQRWIALAQQTLGDAR